MIALPPINAVLADAAHVVAAARQADNFKTLSHGCATAGDHIAAPHS